MNQSNSNLKNKSSILNNKNIQNENIKKEKKKDSQITKNLHFF